MLLKLDLVIKQRKICYYISKEISFFHKVWCLLLKIKSANGIILWGFNENVSSNWFIEVLYFSSNTV